MEAKKYTCTKPEVSYIHTIMLKLVRQFKIMTQKDEFSETWFFS